MLIFSMSNNLFALYGTELEELDEEKGGIVSRKPTAIQDQIVTDERGRRRFHGAFTGGFSAGYFNSVGSKEGWTPQEFKSSRDQRATRFQQMAEDLMDEEDLGEYGIGQRRIRQSENFLSGGSEKRRMAWEHDSTTLSNHLKSIVQPVSDSVGTRMLRAMGWREGRGIGLPISKKHQRKVEDEHETESDFDREQIARIAPQFELTQEDVLISYLEPVEGVHGLGYEGLRPTTVLDQSYGKMASTLKIEEKSRGIRGQAFGVGAFEDEDENVYSQYDLSQFNFALDGPEIESETATVDVTFLQTTKRLNSRTFYAPPKLPPNFKPTHRSVILNSDKLPDGLRDAMKNMTVIQRAKLLGEDRTSVMELVNDKDRKKLVSRTHRSRWDQRESSNKDDSDKDRLVFSDEPMKQARFKEFLKYLRRGLVFPQPNGMSVWEWEAEKKDFEAALTSEERGMLPEVRSRSQPLAKSSLALPIQELLQNKFTKETGNLPQTGHRDEDKLSAVRIGMFGERTRTSFKWYPDNLLAKRFNVPNPYPDVDIVGVPQLQKMNRKETILNLGLPNTANELLFRREGKSHRIKKEEELEENIAGKQREETEKEVEKPPVSVFDAIFGNSSSSDTEKEEEEEEREKDIQIDPQREGVEVMKNNDESKTADSSVSKKIITVMDLDEEFGPPPPPGDNQALSGFSMLRYLKEELDRKKARRANHKKHKSKKLKKERKTKSKKSRKEKKSKSEKRKKNRHNQSESSSDESSSDCNNA